MGEKQRPLPLEAVQYIIHHLREFDGDITKIILAGFSSGANYDAYALEDKMLDQAAAEFSFDCYCQTSERKNPDCSPYWEPDLSGLTPTTVMEAEYDGGRSQSEAMLND